MYYKQYSLEQLEKLFPDHIFYFNDVAHRKIINNQDGIGKLYFLVIDEVELDEGSFGVYCLPDGHEITFPPVFPLNEIVRKYLENNNI
jgi:hypothetical protein